MGAGMYRVRVVGELDSTKIRAELARISKTPLRVNGALGGIGVSAGKAVKGVKGLNGQLVQTNKNIKRLNGKNLNSVASASEKSAKGMRSFGAETLGVTKKVIQFGAITAIVRGVTSGIGDMVQNVFELDGALTEFKKVSDLTGKGLKDYTTQAYKAGRETARTGTEMIEAATQFRKMGYGDQQSMQLATTATMFQNIADAEISAGDAALFINSQLKGFSKQFDTFSSKGEASMHVIDSVNEVANNFAVGTNDLQLALSKTSSAMGGFGNSFEQTIGIITAGTEIMVGQPAKVARGWRTIGANITKLAKSTDTYRDASGKVEIQMRKSDGTMKNTYEFLTDLHKSWGQLNEEQKTAIALEMGGKNQMEVFMATMNNFDTAIEATNTAMNAQGSASKENAKAIASLQGHLQNLKRAWEELSYKMISSDMLKKGMDVLANVIQFLASDTGQAIIKLALLTTGLNLLAKAALGLKGLSLVKVFSGITKGLKGVEGATGAAGASKSVGTLASAFGKLSGSLLGPVGLVAGIGLLSVALAKYVPIGEKARDIKLGKELKEAQTDVEKTEKKYKSLSDELDKLHEKEKEGTLTDSEQNRLTILENQVKQYERQVELKKQLAGNKADEYYHTIDPDKLEGKAKEKYTKEMSVTGRTEKQALASVGINDKIALSLNNVRARADEVAKAQEKVTEAYEKYGEDSPQWTKASEELVKAQKKLGTEETKQGDVLTQLQKIRKKAIKDYGSVKKANKALGNSWKDLNKEIKSLKVLKGLNFKKPSKDISNLKKHAKSLGLEFDKSGKKINKIDLKSFSQKMTEAGYSVEDTWDYIKKLGKENPKIKVNVDGTDVAVKDLKFVDGKIQKIKKEKPKVKPQVQTDKAMQNAEKLNKKLDKVGRQHVKPRATVKASVGNLPALQKSIKNTKGKTVKVGASVSGKGAVDSLKSAIGALKDKVVDVTTRKKTIKEAHGVRHFAGGGTMVNAQVNEQGFEIIQDGDTGLMRIVNGGKRGVTYLGRGDSVYTHGQSVRMLQKAGVSEGEIVYGHGNRDFNLFGVNKLPGYKKGLSQSAYNKKYNKLVATFTKKLKNLESKRDKKNWSNKKFQSEYSKLYKDYQKRLKELNKKKVQDEVKRKTSKEYKKKLAERKKKQDKAYKKKRQDRYNKKYNALTSKYDAKLATLEYKRETQHWSDEAFNKKYTALKNKYNKKLKNLNKNKSIKGAIKKKGIGLDRLRDYGSAVAQTKSEAAKASIENYINGKRLTDKELKNSLASINKQRKAKKLSAQEAEEYRKEAYKKNVEYNLQEYKDNKKTYASMLKLLKQRYKDGKITSEEYYNYLDDLAQTQLEKEKERLTERQTLNDNTYNLAKNYVERQIDLLEKENQEQEEQNELIELQNNLAKARNKRIRVYKEGEGFVYEQDTEAIREATDALKEYQKTSSAENPVLSKWKEVLQLFEDYEADAAIRSLEVQVGSTVAKLFGSMGTDTNAWAKWVKNNLSTTQGLQNVLDKMDKLVDTDDIMKYLDSNGKVSEAIIDSAIKNNALPSTYAAAITQSALSGQIVANKVSGLASQSSISSLTSGAIVNGNSTQYGNIYNFESLVLPNVTNANEFINDLNNLSTTALQTSAQRG